MYTVDQLQKFKEAKAEFLESKKISGDEIPDDKWFRFKQDNYKLEIKPKVRKHKRQVYLWMTYWPWSFAFTILNDPVRKTLRHIYNNIQGSLQKISDRVWKDIKLPDGNKYED